jgi:outer membrane protein OmpA-like peptidoglycan-associated protein
MHPAIPIVIFGALIAIFGEEEAPPPAPPPKPQERIVLLPGAHGDAGAITVTTPQGEAVLDTPYAAADVFAQGSVARVEDTAASVQERFGAALAARPPAPVSFTVYFVFDTDELTEPSRAQFDRIKAELAQRPAPEIIVIGHTDRVGSVPYNDALSLKRAGTVRAALIAAGIAAAQIDVAGRGERELAVSTDDEVAEERNRRVEITVR